MRRCNSNVALQPFTGRVESRQWGGGIDNEKTPWSLLQIPDQQDPADATLGYYRTAPYYKPDADP